MDEGSRYFTACWAKNLKRILAYLCCTKYNEINIFHRDVQKQVLFIGSHKRILIYYGLCLETAGKVFSIVFHGF